jgi:hypothetical protein
MGSLLPDFYIGTVTLRMPETVFWRCTLRKLQALFACHCRMLKNSLPRMA